MQLVFGKKLINITVYILIYSAKILFLNKMDLLIELLKKKSNYKKFKAFYPDYPEENGSDPEKAAEHISDQFIQLSNNSLSKENCFITTGIDTSTMEGVWNTVKEGIFIKRWEKFGIAN